MFASPRQQTCSRKQHEVLDLINLLALVTRFCFCSPLRLYHLCSLVLTAARDSACMTALSHQLLVRNTTMKFPFYSPAVSVRIQSDRWRIDSTAGFTPQGCIFVQSPPSLDGGLDSRSMSVFIICFLIAFQRHWCCKILERLLAHCCFQHIRRFSI